MIDGVAICIKPKNTHDMYVHQEMENAADPSWKLEVDIDIVRKCSQSTKWFNKPEAAKTSG